MAKPLAKKYKSFQDDYNTFIDNLEENPIQISLLSIYDKSDIDNVSDAYIKQIVSEAEK